MAAGEPTQTADSRPGAEGSVEDQIAALMNDELDIVPAGEDEETDDVTDQLDTRDLPRGGDEPDEKPDEKPDDASEEEEEESEERESEGKPDEKPDDDAAGDEPAIETLGDLAKSFDVSEEDLTELIQVPLADGTKANLKDVVQAYVDAPAAARIATEVETERASLATRSEALAVKEKAGLEQLVALTDVLLSEIDGDVADLKKLEESDPLLFIQKKTVFDRKRAAIGQALGRIRATDTEDGERANGERAAYAKEQAAHIAKDHPTWVNPQTGAATDAGLAASKQIDEYLLSLGYTQQEIDEDLIDHRQINAVWEASEYRRLKKKIPATKLRQRLGKGKRKKVLTARTARSSVTRGQGRSRKLRENLARSGSEDDAAAAIADALF